MRLLVIFAMTTVLGGCDAESLTGTPPLPVAETGAAESPVGEARIIVCRHALMPTGPLYIVNGQIVSSEEALRLDTAIIDSVEVVKGTAASGLYGSRAALWVVIIFARAEGLSGAR